MLIKSSILQLRFPVLGLQNFPLVLIKFATFNSNVCPFLLVQSFLQLKTEQSSSTLNSPSYSQKRFFGYFFGLPISGGKERKFTWVFLFVCFEIQLLSLNGGLKHISLCAKHWDRVGSAGAERTTGDPLCLSPVAVSRKVLRLALQGPLRPSYLST